MDSIFNDDFEGTTPTGWYGTGATITTDTTRFHSGSRSLKIVTSNVNAGEGANMSAARPPTSPSGLISVLPRATYSLDVWLYGNGHDRIQVLMDTYDVDLNSVGSAGSGTDGVRTPAGWTHYTYQVTVAPTGRWANIQFLSVEQTSLTFWVDGLVVTPLLEPGTVWATPHTYVSGEVLTAPTMNRYERNQLYYLYDRLFPAVGHPSIVMPFEQRSFGSWKDAAYIDVAAGTWLLFTTYQISTPDETGGGGQNGVGKVRLIDNGGVGTLTEVQAAWETSYASSLFAVHTFTEPNTRINTSIRFDEGGSAPWPTIDKCLLYALRVSL